jgi:glycosyltransferase involved in cell wall biosynthesis
VIIPVRDGARFLGAAVESVLNQTYPRVECIVVDDGSTDQTPSVIASFGNRIRSYAQPNQGVSRARNRGAQLAKGDLLAFLDADDCLKPVMFERQLTRLRERPEAAVIYTASELVDEHGRHLAMRSVPPAAHAFASTVALEQPALGIAQAALIRREAFIEAGGFDERLSTSGDCDLACRLATTHSFAVVDEPLFVYRQHSAQMHHDLVALERDMRIVHKKLLVSDGNLARHARANLHLILANLYWRRQRRLGHTIWHLAQAAFERPVRVACVVAFRRLRTADEPFDPTRSDGHCRYGRADLS